MGWDVIQSWLHFLRMNIITSDGFKVSNINFFIGNLWFIFGIGSNRGFQPVVVIPIGIFGFEMSSARLVAK